MAKAANPPALDGVEAAFGPENGTERRQQYSPQSGGPLPPGQPTNRRQPAKQPEDSENSQQKMAQFTRMLPAAEHETLYWAAAQQKRRQESPASRRASFDSAPSGWFKGSQQGTASPATTFSGGGSRRQNAESWLKEVVEVKRSGEMLPR